MSRSTFYLHYQDQYDLLNDIENDVLEKTYENLSKMDSEINSIESITYFLDYVKDNKETFGILLCNPENLHFQQTIMNNVQGYIQSVVPTYESSSLENYKYSFVMHGSLSVIVDWINNDFAITSSELAALIYHSCNKIVI